MAAVVVVAMMSGCVSYSASKTTAKVGAGITLAGLVLALMSGVDSSKRDREVGVAFGLVFGVAPGVVVGVAGLIGLAAPDEPSDEPPPERELRVDPECLQQRSARLKRAQEITDRDQRTKALLVIPVCEPVPVQQRGKT